MKSHFNFYSKIGFLLLLQVLIFSCVEKNTDPTDPAAAFAHAREPYDDKLYEQSIQRLGEFKSKFPYSKHAPEAELMIADAHFQLNHFAEAAIAYEQFVKMHPKHDRAPFAQSRIGDSYWSEAPDNVDREQEFTAKAIEEWEKLISLYPTSEQARAIVSKLEKGKRRIAEHADFIASFYCKRDVFHACAYRSIQLAEKYPQFSELRKKSLDRAAQAMEELANGKNQSPEDDSNLYYKNMSSEQLKQKSQELRALSRQVTL